MNRHSEYIPGGRGRVSATLVAASLLLGITFFVIQASPAAAVTAQQRYDRGQAEITEIAGSVEGLREQVAADNRTVDELLGRLGPLRARALDLQTRLTEKQATLERVEADLAREKARLVEVRSRLDRALDVLREQLVTLYMSGSPDTAEMVLGAASWSELVSRNGYASAIQDRNDSAANRVRSLRDQIAGMVQRMKTQEKELEAARDRIAAEEREAVVARDQIEAERAEFLAASDARAERIAALEARAGSLEDNLPDLNSDPAGSDGPESDASEAAAPQAAAPASGQNATLGSDGLAVAPSGAPQAVKDAIAAANSIAHLPYMWGGGHGSFESSGYDCSGAVSYALHGGNLISSPLDSTGLTTWGEPGGGNWITVYGNSGHVYIVIAGLRFDTSDTGGSGPGWTSEIRDSSGFTARHPSGL